MPAPKRLRIINELADRLAGVGDTVYRDRREPQAEELPCFLVWSNGREAGEQRNRRSMCTMTVTVTGYRRLDAADPEQLGNDIIAEIMEAMELEDNTLGGLLMVQPGLEWVSDQIYMPESGDNVVAAEVIYSVPHIRIDGDAEII